jgi:prepilin-type N-terminal cleavage/methylation domain-containing protein
LRASPRAKPRAMSLIELIVSIGIISIVVMGAAQVFQEGLQLFRTNQGANDAQASAIKTLSVLNAEMVNAHPDLVEVHDQTAPTDPAGVIFASPLNSDGNAQFNSTTGKVYWQKYVCYYYDPHPTDPARGKLFRKELVIGDEIGIEAGRTGNSNIGSVEANIPDLAVFTSASDLPTRILGESVSGFRVALFTGEVDDGSGGTKSVLGGSGLTRKDSYDIILETGDKNNNGPSGYYIRVDSRVAPRG